MEERPEPWFKALRSSHERLASLVDGLGPDGLERQSYATEWSNAQVISHLGSGGEIFEMFFDAALQGSEIPSREQFEPIWAAWNARTPAEQAADGLAQDRRVLDRFESLDDEQKRTLSFQLFGMEANTTFLARMRLGEHALHTWDIAVADDSKATVSPEAVALLIDDTARFATRAGKPQGEQLRVHITTTDPERHFLLVEDGDQLTFSQLDEAAEADAEMVLPAEALVRLIAGRLDSDHTPAEVEARGVDLDALRTRYPGF